MYKHFGNIGENLPVNIFLSPDFANCRPNVNRIRIKWITEPFYTDAFTDEIYPDTDTDDKYSPNVIYLTCSVFSGYAMRILIRRCGLGDLVGRAIGVGLINFQQVHQYKC